MHKRVENISTVCRKRSTVRLARSYFFILPEAKPHAEFACPYIASMHLKNNDVFAYRTAARGGLMPKPFWRLVLAVERVLQDAARDEATLPNGRTFTYKRLPRHKPRCATCERVGLPCLVGRRRRSDKCEVCRVRKGKCERDEPGQALNLVRQPVEEEQEIEITGWRLGGGPLQDSNGLVNSVNVEAIHAVNRDPSYEGIGRSRCSSPDGVSHRELVRLSKAREAPIVATPVMPAACSSRILEKRRAENPPEGECPPPKRRVSDAHAASSSAAAGDAQSMDNGTHPRCVASSSRAPAAPAAPIVPHATPDLRLGQAYKKAAEIVQLVTDLGDAVPIEIRVPVSEMRDGLAELGSGSGELAGLEGESLLYARQVLEAAASDVVKLDEAGIANISLRTMVRCLKGRVRDLAAA